MTTDLLERLAAHRTLKDAPRAELEWLATHGEYRHVDAGNIVVRKGEVATEMYVLLTGRIVVHFEHGTGRRHQMESTAGEVTGLLPYSRLSSALGDVLVEETIEFLAFGREQLPGLIRECPMVTATLVHAMIDRARRFSSKSFQDEKMVSLGKLAAGMAHELNNPASAASRSAKQLGDAIKELGLAAHALGASHMNDAEQERVAELVTRSMIPQTTGIFSALERTDREEEMANWLEEHDADEGPAAALADSGIEISMLDELTETLSGPALDAALRWIAATYTAQALASEVERATNRIHDLVSSVKRFAYMDRAPSAHPTNIAEGLQDTISILASKAKEKSVAVRLEVVPDLPLVPATGELNQVWSNLLGNALDAVEPMGEVSIKVARTGSNVMVSFVDNGPGIPADVQERIFDPFFTTKPVGKGTGLGLDIALQVVRAHNGKIEFNTRPGHTEFCVSLPLA